MGRINRIFFLFILSLVLLTSLSADKVAVKSAVEKVLGQYPGTFDFVLKENENPNYADITITHQGKSADFRILIPEKENQIEKAVREALQYDIKTLLDVEGNVITGITSSTLIADYQSVKPGQLFELGQGQGMAAVREVNEKNLLLDRLWASNVYPYMAVSKKDKNIKINLFSSLQYMNLRINFGSFYYPFSFFAGAAVSYSNFYPQAECGIKYTIPLSKTNLLDTTFTEDGSVSSSFSVGIRKEQDYKMTTSFQIRYEHYLKSPFQWGVGIQWTHVSEAENEAGIIFSLSYAL